MAVGDYTDADTGAMDAFSQRVVDLVRDVPGGALRRTVEPACAGGLDVCKDLVAMDAAVTEELQRFITDVRYGFTAYALFVRDEGMKYLTAGEDAARGLTAQAVRKETLDRIDMRQDRGLPRIAPEFPPQPK